PPTIHPVVGGTPDRDPPPLCGESVGRLSLTAPLWGRKEMVHHDPCVPTFTVPERTTERPRSRRRLPRPTQRSLEARRRGTSGAACLGPHRSRSQGRVRRGLRRRKRP